jgi:tRNA 2-thiouridine synthesizing protein C
MRYLFLLRQTPYGSTLAREALDMALATAAFDQQVQLLFINDGVYQLINEQNSVIKQRKNISKTLAALELYDINEVYADISSINDRGLNMNDLFATVNVIDKSAMHTLIQQADIVINL